MSFSHWLSELRTQEQQHKFEIEDAESVASSWAETDSDSDSDSEHSNFGFCGDKMARKITSRKHDHQRTAPISIPQATYMNRTRSASHTQEFEHEGELEEYHSRHSPNMNEDDLMLFGNLAYFRTQHADKAGWSPRSNPVSDSASSSEEDDEIFEMEL